MLGHRRTLNAADSKARLFFALVHHHSSYCFACNATVRPHSRGDLRVSGLATIYISALVSASHTLPTLKHGVRPLHEYSLRYLEVVPSRDLAPIHFKPSNALFAYFQLDLISSECDHLDVPFRVGKGVHCLDDRQACIFGRVS